jgi:hypothetical protein
MRGDRADRAALVLGHQPAVANRIRAQDRREPPLDFLGRHE